MHCQHEDAQHRLVELDLLDEFDAGAPGHREIEYDHARWHRSNQRDGARPVVRFAGDDKSARALQDVTQALSHKRVVVCYQKAGHSSAPSRALDWVGKPTVAVPLHLSISMKAPSGTRVRSPVTRRMARVGRDEWPTLVASNGLGILSDPFVRESTTSL